MNNEFVVILELFSLGICLFHHGKALTGQSAPLAEDMINRKAVKAGKLSLYLAGPPCPSFCPGGTGTGLGDARGMLLIKAVERILVEKPLTFIIENSGALLEKRFAALTQQLMKVFVTAGYKTSAQKLIS